MAGLAAMGVAELGGTLATSMAPEIGATALSAAGTVAGGAAKIGRAHV